MTLRAGGAFGRRKKLARLAAWLLPLLAPSPSAWAASTRAPQAHPGLADTASAECTACHESLFQGKLSVHPPAREDCTLCHDVQTSAAGTTITPAAEGAALCLACHDAASLEAPHGGQLAASASCVGCHSPHGSANRKLLVGTVLHAPFAERKCAVCHRSPMGGRIRLQGRVDGLCASCHPDIPSSSPPGGSWHPALAGSGTTSGCLPCHDPHLSPNRNLLTKTGTALCVSCHAEVVTAANAEGGHAPAADDCLSCHRPHAAPVPFLLAEDPPAVCLGCHDAAEAGLRKAHLGAEARELDCASCHTPHGAGHPGALARYLHAPITEGCDVCHQGSASKLVEEGEPPLCLLCHEDVGETAAAAEVPHAAMDVARCVDCHNPHASSQPRLVKLPGGGECLACHSDQAPGEGETAHGAIGLVGCQACHEPHGGSRPRLLRALGNELCLGCHRAPASRGPAEGMVELAGRFEVPATAVRNIPTFVLSPDGTRGHPTRDHLVLAPARSSEAGPAKSSFEGDLSCLACHDPHKGAWRLLPWGATSASSACLHCHQM